MIQQIEISNVGILWADKAFENIPAVHHYLRPPPETKKLPPQQLNPAVLAALKRDVEQPIHDKLGTPFSVWWLLEFIPLWKHVLNSKSERCKELW